MNFIDPSGLWSISIGGYAGFGGGLTFGRNPGGGFFGAVRGGIGIGGGISWDKNGSSPDGNNCGGISTGQFAEAGANFGPLEIGISSSSGFSQTNGPYATPFPPQPTGGATPSIGVGAGVSGGFEIIFH
ncbi:MAG: hypothetical protein ACOYOK_01855 [Pseudobdellovibrionaceae bacterium]